MSIFLRWRGFKPILRLCIAVVGLALPLPSGHLLAQTATGSIIGTVKDSSGSVVPGVKVTIRSLTVGTSRVMTTTERGTYSLIGLQAGPYIISFVAPSFETGEKTVDIRVGQTTNGDFTLRVGEVAMKVIVQNTGTEVDTSQAMVQDVLTTQQIENMPLNGRNFLDLAQLSPGVQVQDGGNFDPTKNGFTGLSFQGRSGRQTRIEVDGVDISDEAVGTTTTNISEDSIQEFQVAQSTLDPATSLTTTGAVNVITRSGSNELHGSGFYLFRDSRFAARIGDRDAPFQRNQSGFRIGGPFLKDKLFWFANLEHSTQHGTAFIALSDPFSSFNGAFPSPFHETMATARLDWNLTKGWRSFYSFHHDQLNGVLGFGGTLLNPFSNHNITDFHTIGLDGTLGRSTHSFRVGYLRFRNGIVDARSNIASLPFTNLRAGIGVGGSDTTCGSGSDLICVGANFNAPQHTFQHNQEFRYDGAYSVRSHTFRYGVEYIHIPQAIDASLAGIGPILFSTGTNAETNQAANGPFPGGTSNPLNYPLDVITFGNGLGFFSEKPALGLPHGGFLMHRFAAYVGDLWKIRPNFTLSMALRYTRDSGRTNSDLPSFPQLQALLPGAGRRTNQPNLNLGPQVGIAWDPFSKGRTSIRAGMGLFYDDFIVNSFLLDRLMRIPNGIGNVTLSVNGGTLPGTNVDTSPFFGQPIGSVLDQVIAAQAAYQAANQAASRQVSLNGTPGFLDPNEFDRNTFGGYLDPKYHTPVSTQFNIGIQKQIGSSLFLSVDFLHNTNVHSPLAHDVNLVGAAQTLNVPAAQAAITATLSACGVMTIQQSLAGCPNFPMGRPATISDFSDNGLGSPATGFNGQFVSPNSGFAFAGIDPNFGSLGVISEVGRSTYNALQVRVRQNIDHPFTGVRHLSWTASYNLSRFNAMVGDQDNALGNFAFDNINSAEFYGPNALDRTHMISAGGTVDLPAGVRISFLTRVNSALPVTLRVPFACGCAAEIFLTDFTGDGSGNDVLPGTNIGAFGRSVSVGSLNDTISNYNSRVAGTFTPSGQALVVAGLFSPAQLKALGAVSPSVPVVPSGHVGVDNFVADDLRVSWELRGRKFHFREGLILEPSVDIFNVVNKANFDPPQQLLRGNLSGTPGSVNGTTVTNRFNRYGLGSGVFSVGIPRAIQFGLRLTL